MYGDKLKNNVAIFDTGQIIHISQHKVTLRRGQPIFVSPKAILHKYDGDFIDEIWDPKLNNFLRQMTSLEKITNNEYGGGTLHRGGVVHIRSEPRGNVFDYVILR